MNTHTWIPSPTRISQYSKQRNTQRNIQKLGLIIIALAVIVAGSWLIGKTSLGLIVVIGLGAAIAGLIMVSEPQIGMYILVAFIYLNLSDIIEVAFGVPSLNKLLVALTAVSIIGSRAILRKQPLNAGRVEFGVLAYMVVVTISAFFGGDTGSVFSNIVDNLKDFTILLIIVQVCDNERHWKRLIWILIFSAAFIAALTWYQMLTGDRNEFYGLAKAPVHQIVGDFDSTRPTGPIEDPNYYGQILLMILPMALYRFLTEERRLLMVLGGVTAILIGGAAIFTYSRATFLVMIVVATFVLYERKVNLYKAGFIVVAIYILAYPILPAGFTDRIATLTDVFSASETKSDSSFVGRTSEAIVAIQMFADNPILGAGYASYGENYLSYSVHLGLDDRLQDREAHSMYLEVAAETGIFGIVSFAFMLGVMFVSIRDLRKELVDVGRQDIVPWLMGVQFGLVSYMLTSIFLHDSYGRYFRLILAIVAGSIIASQTIVKRQQKERQNAIYIQGQSFK